MCIRDRLCTDGVAGVPQVGRGVWLAFFWGFRVCGYWFAIVVTRTHSNMYTLYTAHSICLSLPLSSRSCQSKNIRTSMSKAVKPSGQSTMGRFTHVKNTRSKVGLLFRAFAKAVRCAEYVLLLLMLLLSSHQTVLSTQRHQQDPQYPS